MCVCASERTINHLSRRNFSTLLQSHTHTHTFAHIWYVVTNHRNAFTGVNQYSNPILRESTNALILLFFARMATANRPTIDYALKVNGPQQHALLSPNKNRKHNRATQIRILIFHMVNIVCTCSVMTNMCECLFELSVRECAKSRCSEFAPR